MLDSANENALVGVLQAARRFVALQARAEAVAQPVNLADAIERDFMLFDLHEAGTDLRRAVQEAEFAGAPRFADHRA